MTGAEWRVLIADDEPAARRGIRQLLAAFPEFEVVRECRNGEETLAAMERMKPDVVFLDVQMPGVGGFEVIRRRTPERMPLVVIVTAYDRYAIRAFEAEAIDYLVKPVNEARFRASMRRVLRQLRAFMPPPPEARLTLASPRGTRVVRAGEIDWIESADNYARIWIGGRSHLLRESLRDLEARLRVHGFVRAHRRALVPLARVRALERMKDGALLAVLSGGARVPVSRRLRASFVRAVQSPAPR